jgi:hypothetical protein
LVWLLDTLLEGAHEPDTRNCACCNVRELELEEQTVLTRVWVADLGDAITRAADLESVLLDLNTSEETLLTDVVPLALTLLLGSTAGQVGLMLPALCMREVRAVVLVDRETQTAFEAADVVLEEVRVLVEVDGLERELAETLSSVGVGC